eukprot:SAG22_NODE_565_length_9046_cov_142.250475_10_plen_77_part_00
MARQKVSAAAAALVAGAAQARARVSTGRYESREVKSTLLPIPVSVSVSGLRHHQFEVIIGCAAITHATLWLCCWHT